MLADQHRQALELLRRAGSVNNPAKRRQHWVEARRSLISHERAEEQVVYAMLEGRRDAQSLLEQHGEQAVELELTIADLEATDTDSDEWVWRLRDLTAMVAEHVREEESDFFPRAQRFLGENLARELEDPYVKAQREALEALA
ncbi:MAG TPA: hemerythrin domain-containing protein [Polyangiaceae bacterium]|nr:hemerythrin domain-containing protein [Polyangiaceae bacterium]